MGRSEGSSGGRATSLNCIEEKSYLGPLETQLLMVTGLTNNHTVSETASMTPATINQRCHGIDGERSDQQNYTEYEVSELHGQEG